MSGPRESQQLGFGDLDGPGPEAAAEAPREPIADEPAPEPEPEPEYEEPLADLEPEPPIPARRSRREAPEPPPRRAYDLPAAPVVTDDGVYGTLPPPRRTLGDYEDRERPARTTWAGVVGVLFTLAAAAWLVLYSTAQATSETVAVPAIERTVEALTGLERLLILHETAIRNATDDPAAIPGFEVAGVSLSRAEVAAGTPSEWHATLLERSARAVHASGPGVLSADGTPLDGGRFSTSGGALLLMETLSESNSGRTSALLLPVGIAAAGLLAGIMALGGGFARFQVAGLALLVAALPAVAMGLLGMALVAVIGSDGSDLADTTHEIAAELVRIPLRNGLTALAAGLAVAIPARVAGAILDRVALREAATE